MTARSRCDVAGEAAGPMHGGPCVVESPCAVEPAWLTLPPQIAPFQNLTQQVHGCAPVVSPFDGDPVYDRLFDDCARALHRRSPRHVVLVRERGVGDHAILTELARLAHGGARYPLLADKQVIRVDCRFVPPDESRARLKGLFAAVGPHAELIVCIDGLASLLPVGLYAGNRAVLLAALGTCGCRIIGMATPAESEEHFESSADAQEFFSFLRIPEPDRASECTAVIAAS